MPNTTVPVAATGLPTRRLALTALATFGAATALPRLANATARSDELLLVLGRALDAVATEAAPLIAALNRTNSDEDYDAYSVVADKASPLYRQIAAEPATTLEGLAVKARALAYIYHDGLSAAELDFSDAPSRNASCDNSLAWSIITDLLTSCGAAHLIGGVA